MPEASGMDIEELTAAVRAMQDSLAAVSRDQVRMQDRSTCLEQRVMELEQHISGQLPPKDNIEGLPVSPDATVQKDDGEEASKETYIDALEHSLGESLWEAPIIIALPGLRTFNAGLVLLALLLNATVQIYLCVVLLTSGDFIRPDRFYDLERPMRHWRATHAHSMDEVDAAGRSLASRVCGHDQSLAVALSQGNLLTEINAYLGLQPTDLQSRGLGTGPLLCTMCIFLFTGLVMKELRSLAESLLAVCAVPRGRRTRLENGSLVALSPGRFALFMVTGAARAAIALMLLYTGIFWLAATSSITDLILNAAALGFVMDFDEILFDTVVPTTVHLFVQKLEPVKYRRPCASLEAVVPLAATIITVCLSTALLVEPNLQQMLLVKGVLCSGNLEFATSRNSANFIVSMPTLPFVEDTDINVEHRATQELIGFQRLGEEAPRFSLWAALPGLARRALETTLQEQGEVSSCEDQDSESAQRRVPYMFAALRYEVGTHTGISVAERPFRCAEYAIHCQTSGLARLLCPITCGCDNPTSGLVEATPTFGCPSSCGQLRQLRLRFKRCEDNISGNAAQNWSSYWWRFSHLVATGWSINETTRRDLDGWTERKILEGCNNTDPDPVYGTDFCNAEDIVFKQLGLSNIVGFCPDTCCRDLPRSLKSSCPVAC